MEIADLIVGGLYAGVRSPGLANVRNRVSGVAAESLAVAINILWYNGYGFMLHLHTIDLFQHCYGGLRRQEVLAALILIHPPNNRRRNLVSYFGRYRCLAQIIW